MIQKSSNRETFDNIGAQCYDENVKLKQQRQMLFELFASKNIAPEELIGIVEDEVDGANEPDHFGRRIQGILETGSLNRLLRSDTKTRLHHNRTKSKPTFSSLMLP